MCQWKTFILTASIPSKFRLRTSIGVKCRLESMSSPRQPNRGESLIATAGAAKPSGETSTSCKKVCNPRKTPRGFAASSFAPVDVTSSVYDSSSPNSCVSLLAWSVYTTNFAFVASPGWLEIRSPVCFCNTDRKRCPALSRRASLCPVNAIANVESIFSAPLPGCTFAGQGIKFNPGADCACMLPPTNAPKTTVSKNIFHGAHEGMMLQTSQFETSLSAFLLLCSGKLEDSGTL